MSRKSEQTWGVEENNTIKLALVAAAASAGIAACTATPDSQPDAAPQTSSPPLTVVTEIVTLTVTKPPKPDAMIKVDHRIGYGTLKLGMTLDEVRAAGIATGLSVEGRGEGDCVADDKIVVSPKYGVVRISLPADAKTSKGIGVGSTFGDVKRAYPDAAENRAGWWTMLNDNDYYAFTGDIGSDANKVLKIKLQVKQHDCALAVL